MKRSQPLLLLNTMRVFWMVMALLVSVSSALYSDTFPSGFVSKQVATGLSSPTAMAFSPDGRLFVCEQTGALRLIKNDTLLSKQFLAVTVSSIGERGLLGVAFDPDFNSNHYLYIYYTATSPAVHNRISRFTANGDTALPGSEMVILELNNLSSASNHNGGAIHFGPDGKLYAAVGENAMSTNSQTLSNLLGKMLRINPDGTIPTDNPFYNSAVGNNRAIWALGVRNPFTFAFQPSSTRMFINDVGENSWEEINDGIRGSNYGWPTTEGYTSDTTFRGPIYAYAHGFTDLTGCAITGGAFYNPLTTQFPSSYVGDYFFADYCGGWIRIFHPADSTVRPFGTGIGSPVDLQVSADGSLYYLFRSVGGVAKVQYAASLAPNITAQPSDLLVSVGKPAAFSVSASGALPLSYQWKRNSVNISGATSPLYTIPSAQLSDSGALFRCMVTNSFGTATSNQARLSVTTNTSPTAAITAPVAGSLYSAGDTIHYAGTGTDAEDGTMPPSAFTWQVDFHHDTHTHPFIPPTSGSGSGSFVVPTTGEASANVWYRIYLTVSDNGGLRDTTFTDVHPHTSVITIDTDPTGMQTRLDGQPQTTPLSFTGVVGLMRMLEAVTPQTFDAQQYSFVSWSDGGASLHDIATPSGNTTYTALFETPLPIQLSSFTGIHTGINTVELRWTTMSEVNNYGFHVQRRVDNEQRFTEIAGSFVAGRGTTNVPQQYSYTDAAGPGTRYYRLEQIDLDGTIHLSDPLRVDVVTDAREQVPAIFNLTQNYPNPFNPKTAIRFSVAAPAHAVLAVYDMLGRTVATLFDDVATPGQYYGVTLDGTNLSSGVYTYRLQSGSSVDIKKLLLCK